MKRLSMVIMVVLAVGPMAFASVPELQLSTGTTTSGTIMGGTGSVTYSNTNFGGWDISLVFGSSNSPSLVPYGIDITNLTAACVSSTGCSTLNVFLSDQNFTQTVTGFQSTYSTTQTGSTPSTSQTAWVGLGNGYFAQTSLIGSIGPLTTSGTGGTVVGGPAAGPGAYSLTIEDTFAGCSGTGCVSYSSDGNITGVPEPVGVVLFGTVLAFLGSRLRRRKSA
jgi:hypothetical protein